MGKGDGSGGGVGAAVVWCERADDHLAQARADLVAAGTIEWAGPAGSLCAEAVHSLVAAVARLRPAVARAHEAARRAASASGGVAGQC